MQRSWVCFLVVFIVFQVAAATTAPARQPIPPPSSVVTVGPGTVISVRVLDLAFAGKYFVVTYGTDRGGIIEVWHRGKLVVVPGMHGMMTYGTNPETILDFRIIDFRTVER
jgi:hypothetical protein